MSTKLELAQIALKDVFPAKALEELYMAESFKTENHTNPATKITFTGYNKYQLELEYLLNGYNSCEWSTFNQYKADNKMIKKGSKGTKLTLAVHNKEKNEQGQEVDKLKFFKGYTVFNKEQVQ